MRADPRFPLGKGHPDAGQPLETAALTLLLGLILLGVLLWLAGELAGQLFGGAWPGLSPAEMGPVLVALADRPGDPAQAWPPAARPLLPGPLASYATLTLLLAVPLALAAAVLRARRDRRGGRSPAASRWARLRDLRPLAVRSPERGRLTLGRAGRRSSPQSRASPSSSSGQPRPSRRPASPSPPSWSGRGRCSPPR